MRQPRTALAAVLALAGLLCAVAPAQAARKPQATVMTRNLFLGTDLVPLAAADPGAAFEQAAGKAFAAVQATDPNARMKLVAAEIARAKPDLVGLQEVTTWRTGPKGDPAPATTVVYDYISTIKSELARLGAKYRVVGLIQHFDVEGPSDGGVDVRVTIGDAVLVKDGVKVSHVKSADFRQNLQFPTKALGAIPVTRSWDSLDAKVDGVKIHVVNAHLEAYSTTDRLAQAKELVAGPLKSRLPTILLGDLNSGPNLAKADDRPPFLAIKNAGFTPERTSTPQCCWNDDLKSGTWDHIVDWILSKPKLKLLKSSITGSERTASGLYPSDHGGVVSKLRLTR